MKRLLLIMFILFMALYNLYSFELIKHYKIDKNFYGKYIDIDSNNYFLLNKSKIIFYFKNTIIQEYKYYADSCSSAYVIYIYNTIYSFPYITIYFYPLEDFINAKIKIDNDEFKLYILNKLGD